MRYLSAPSGLGAYVRCKREVSDGKYPRFKFKARTCRTPHGGEHTYVKPRHAFQVIRQAKVGDRPISHSRGTLAVLCLWVATGLIGSPVQAQEPQGRCTQIGQSYVDFLLGQDVTKAVDVFTEDFVFEDVPSGDVTIGRTQFQVLIPTFFDDFLISRFELVQATCRGDQGAIEWSQSFEDGRVNPPAAGDCGTGKSMTSRGVSIIEIRGNKTSRLTDYWDYFDDLKQLPPESGTVS